MFVNGFNFILGHKNSGRSQFLFLVADIFKTLNYKCIFYGATDEYNTSSYSSIINNKNTPFDLMFFYRHGDSRITENVLELSKNKKFNYIFIDDIDYMSSFDLKILSKIEDIPVICTCDISKIPDKITNYKSFELIKNDERLIQYDDIQTNLNNFYNTLKRDQKINLIINDKG